MPTLVWLEGFEHQNVSGSGWDYAPNVWFSVSSSGSISFVSGRTGGVCARFTLSAGGTSWLETANAYNVVTTPTLYLWGSASQYFIGSFWFRVTSGPTGGTARLFTIGRTGFPAAFRMNTAGTITFMDQTTARTTSGSSYNDSSWHRIDFKMDTTANTMDWMVDGTTIATGDAINASAYPDHIAYGNTLSDSATITFDIDDAVFSTTSADYPLGEHKVLSLLPNADGTHNLGSAGLAKSTGGTTDVWDVIDEIPMSITDYLLQATAGTTNYLEFHFPDSTEASCNGARMIVCTASAGTATNAAQVTVLQSTTVYARHSGDFSAATAQHNAWMIGSVTAWTPSITNLNALYGRFGQSSDATPDPWLGGIALEYAVPVAAATGKAPPFHRQYPRAMIVR